MEKSERNKFHLVIGCSHKTFFQHPAISFRISAEYFENNLNDPNNDYTFTNGYYERTVEESDLDFAFGENDRESTIEK